MPYRVLVDDNFHYQDESYRYEFGVYDSLAEALAVCREIVDRELWHMAKSITTAEELLEAYHHFGEDPFIVTVPMGSEKIDFSAWDYAKERCPHIVQSPDASP